MRGRFLAALTELALADERVIFLTGDLGFMVIEPFAEKVPGRFFNVGVAEQNMIGVATGMAEAGLIPFVYSIATFATLRPFEFIRNGPVAHKLPVRVIGVGGGFEYGPAGPTHHAVEDVGAMRLLPGMTILTPADAAQAETALQATWDLPGPVYYRLGKNETHEVAGLNGTFRLGLPDVLRAGHEVALISMGPLAFEALAAADELQKAGIIARVVSLASIAPLDISAMVECLAEIDLAVTIEAHNVDGGLGSLVSEVVAEQGLGCRVLRLGANGHDHGTGGSDGFHLTRHHLTGPAVAATVLSRVAAR